jgi:malate synthase
MADVRVAGPQVERSEEVLTPQAPAFVADLQARFGAHRETLPAHELID